MRLANPCPNLASAEFVPEKMLLVLRSGKSFYHGLSLLSQVDTPDAEDETAAAPQIELLSETHVAATVSSSLWKKKTQHYVFAADGVRHWIELEGEGAVDRLHFGRGILNGLRLGSAPGYTQFFNPLPNFIEKQQFHAAEFSSIAAGNTTEILAQVRGCGLHGAPLCFVAHEENRAPFMAAGILAKPGEYIFNSFDVNHLSDTDRKQIAEPIIGTQSFSLAYHGHLKIYGKWVSPTLLLDFSGTSCLDAVARYVATLGVPPRRRSVPAWTRRPVFCTWHEQVAVHFGRLAANSSQTIKEAESANTIFDELTQANCGRWLRALNAKGLNPGTLILDAKWQGKAGDLSVDAKKFPDLRGFVDACHAQGVRVILWHNGWDADGVPDAERCRVDGKPGPTDPTNPAFQRRLSNYVERMLSDKPGCYNADGLKVDGMTNTPYGPTLETHGRLAGFELARALLELLHAAAAEAKPDAAIGQFTGFPYFGDLCELARTGDLYTVKGDPNSANAFRAAIQNLAMPGVPVDTDGALRFNYILPDRDILECQAKIGVPCVYQAETLLQRRDLCLPQLKAMDDNLYADIAATWERHQRNNSAINLTGAGK